MLTTRCLSARGCVDLKIFWAWYIRPMEGLQQKLDEIYTLPEPIRSEFAAAWKPIALEKGAHLLREGGVSNYFYFITKGVARIYYHKKNKEVTEWLALENTFFFSIRSFFTRQASSLAIHVLEPSDVLLLHHDDLMRFCDRYHEAEKLFRRMLSNSLIFSQTRMESIQFETAHQRYQGLIQKNPDILQRVPLSYIASFLGMTQETLSRVRGAK